MHAAAAMDQALRLAGSLPFSPYPNPRVGAVLFKNGRILGWGWHRGPGQPHAEAEALDLARARGEDPRGASLAVTLEPCCHSGPGKRTPPCAQRLIAEGIAEVWAGCPDPNPAVAGRGMALLAAAGVRSHWGPQSEAARVLIADFGVWIRDHRPFITLKWAQSLDGRLADSQNRSQWLTGPRARQEVQELRALQDGVAVGAGTLEEDDPCLLPRREDHETRRVIFAGSRPLNPRARVFSEDPQGKTWLVVRPGSPAAAQAPQLVGSRVIPWDSQDWPSLGRQLLEKGFTRLLVEGGPRLLDSFRAAGWWDRAQVYIAPLWLGGPGFSLAPDARELSAALRLAQARTRALGPDLVLEGLNPASLVPGAPLPGPAGQRVSQEGLCSRV